MPKKVANLVAQQAASQARQARDEIINQVKKPPSEKVGDLFDQLGVKPNKIPVDSAGESSGQTEKQRIEAMEKNDRQQADQQISALKGKLEEEMQRFRQEREQQLQQRRQETEAFSEMGEAEKLMTAGGKDQKTDKTSLAKKAIVDSRMNKSRAEKAGRRRSG
ncbi:hypothetical protein ACFL0Y_03285 [Patescibacteria group bacterium]